MVGTRAVADIARAIGLDPPVYRRDDVETRVGLPHDDTVRWWRAMGFAEVPPDEVAFGDDDVRMATALATLLASGEVAERDVLRLARVLGASFSRIAEAQVALLEDTSNGSSGSNPDVGTATGHGGHGSSIDPTSRAELLAVLEEAIVYVWRRHLVAAFGRRLRLEDGVDVTAPTPPVDDDHGRSDRRDHHDHLEDDDDVPTTTVGFVDIAGFSKMSKRLGADELADLVDAFEATALEVAAAHDARVVKFIGDAAMYVADDLARGVRVGLELQARAKAGDTPVELHCGVAHGPAVTMGGDVFGPTVNLASRLTDVARRNSVAIPRDCAPELSAQPDLVVRNVRRPYDLKGIGRTRLAVVSLADPPEADPELDGDLHATAPDDSGTADDTGASGATAAARDTPPEEPDNERRSRRDRHRRDRAPD